VVGVSHLVKVAEDVFTGGKFVRGSLQLRNFVIMPKWQENIKLCVIVRKFLKNK
jgi:hypothetical protein